MSLGHRTARITIIPIDDNVPEDTETIILTLAPDTAYVIDRDSSAEAIIVDNDSDRPRTRRLRDGSFHVCMPGTNGIAFRIEATTDLRSWTTVTIGGVTDGAIHFADPNAKDKGPGAPFLSRLD